MNKVGMNGTLRISVTKVLDGGVVLSANFHPEGADGLIPVAGGDAQVIAIGRDLSISGLMMEDNLGDDPAAGSGPLAATSGRGDGVATMTVVKPDGTEE